MKKIEPLFLWRQLPPSRLREIRDLSDDLLCALIDAAVPRSREDEVIFEYAIGDRSIPLFLHYARLDAQKSESVSDIAMSWALLAALENSEVARLALIQGLLHRAGVAGREFLAPFPRSVGSFLVRSPAVRALLRLALAWAVEVDVSFLVYAKDWGEHFKKAATASFVPLITTTRQERLASFLDDFSNPPPRDPIPSPSVVALTWPPLITVVREIGDTHSEEGRAMARLYNPITRPLPLLGGELAPEMLRRVLMLEFPYLADAIDRIVGDLRLRHSVGEYPVQLRPLLLMGPTGVGKTRLTMRIAELLGVGYGQISVAGSADDRAFRGTGRGWRGVQPCIPIITMLRTNCANPILLIDEIDKAGGSDNGGDIKQTLLGMIEPSTARAWFDEALLASADLSHVSWLLTANELEPLSAPLKSRVGIVHCPRPGPEAFDGILEAILGDIAKTFSIDRSLLPNLDPRAIDFLRATFIHDIDIRRLRRAAEAALGAADPVSRQVH